MATLKSLDYKIWGIAWPAILANLSVPLLGLVDAAILGHLDSSRYLGAVALGAALLSFLYWGFGFLRMGTTGRVARALGAGSHASAERELGRAMWLALGLALAVWLAHPLWLDLGFALMAPEAGPMIGASGAIFGLAGALIGHAAVSGWRRSAWMERGSSAATTNLPPQAGPPSRPYGLVGRVGWSLALNRLRRDHAGNRETDAGRH